MFITRLELRNFAKMIVYLTLHWDETKKSTILFSFLRALNIIFHFKENIFKFQDDRKINILRDNARKSKLFKFLFIHTVNKINKSNFLKLQIVL